MFTILVWFVHQGSACQEIFILRAELPLTKLKYFLVFDVKNVNKKNADSNFERQWCGMFNCYKSLNLKTCMKAMHTALYLTGIKGKSVIISAMDEVFHLLAECRKYSEILT